jgi:acetoacetyl-CoA synthetase
MTQGTDEVGQGTLLWAPSEELTATSRIGAYMRWLEQDRGLAFTSYDQLWDWSVGELEDFWASIADYFRVPFRRRWTRVLDRRGMPGAHWFEDAELNYTEVVFGQRRDTQPALLSRSETRGLRAVTWAELEHQVAALAAALRRLGVRKGDRVAAYLPNIPHAVIAFLATASLGAIWSSCAPEFGARSVLDRFSQIEPKVLFAIDGYTYGGQTFDRRPTVAELRARLPSVQATVLVPHAFAAAAAPEASVHHWDDLIVEAATRLEFEPVRFDHPLWILYSSGTTGLPKPIVHGHGGIVLEHTKALALHCNLGPGSRFCWHTSTGWVMWNLLVGSLLVGATTVLYDGSPGHPTLDVLWDLADEAGLTALGVSAAFLLSCRKANLAPGDRRTLSALRFLGSTGSPLPPEGFGWVYRAVKPDIWLASMSGGTDIATGFVMGCPLLPVYAGEIQCRALGVKVEAVDDQGQPVLDRQGELVVTAPMPSMPVGFWSDPDGRRYHESYFTFLPGVWRHGDWLRLTPRGTAVIEGRSDSTLNRLGVRIGTAELYRVIEDFPEIADSLVVGVELPGGGYAMPLFVVLAPGQVLDSALTQRLNQALREQLSPRHVPDRIVAVPAIPRTLTGKKLEVPVKRILLGEPVDRVASPGATLDPAALEHFEALAREWNLTGESRRGLPS